MLFARFSIEMPQHQLTHAHCRTGLVGVVLYHTTMLYVARVHFLARCSMVPWLNYPLFLKWRVLIVYQNPKLRILEILLVLKRRDCLRNVRNIHAATKEYSRHFPWTTNSKERPAYVFCMPCGRDISMTQGGTKDLRKHEQTMSTPKPIKALQESSLYTLILAL